MEWRNKVYVGDVFDFAKTLPPQSIQCLVTSPPYFGLRDYGTAQWEGGNAECDHAAPPRRAYTTASTLGPKRDGLGPDNAAWTATEQQYRGTCRKCGATRIDKQIGQEPTPAAFVAALVAVFRALWPALKDDGTVWLNLGDSYAGHSLTPPRAGQVPGRSVDLATARNKNGVGPVDGLKPKDLIGIPWRVALALQADGWYLRSDIVWAKGNPMPESVQDRPTRSHEYIFLLSKQPRYYYDQEAIREPLAKGAAGSSFVTGKTGINGMGRVSELPREDNPAGRNKRDVWHVNTVGFPESHFATFPPELIRPCILAGTSAHGECAACGKAWVRVVERVSAIPARVGDWKATGEAHRNDIDRKGGFYDATSTTTGWQPQCSCDAPVQPQTVLDPFNGSGTVPQVAVQERRHWIGCDLDARSVGWTAARLAGAQTRLGLEGVA